MRWRLHSMHGLGVTPRRWASTYGLDDLRLELVAEVPHVVGDAELLGHPPGVVDVAHRAAAGVGLAAPQLHRHAHDLVPGGQQAGRGHRRVDPARHGHQHLHAATPRRRATAAGHDRERPVDVGVGGRPAEATAAARRGPARAGRPWPPARGTPAGRRWRRPTPPTRTRPASSSRNSSASLSMPGRHRCSVPGSRWLRRAGAGLDQARGRPPAGPSARRSRRTPTRRPRSPPGRRATAPRAAAKPTMPATSCVPLRSSRSWPPPSHERPAAACPAGRRAPRPPGDRPPCAS